MAERNAWSPSTQTPSKPSALVRKGVIPAALLAALTGPLATTTLERWEGNIRHVYADKLADNIPTYCAGRTDWSAPVGARISSDQCTEVNKVTLLEYGYAVLACTTWSQLTPTRLIGLTIFAINVGKGAACGSQAVARINAGRIAEGCDLLARKPSGAPNWSFASGVYVQGLQNRRQAERTLCLDEVQA